MPRSRHGVGGSLISARFWLLVIDPFSARKLFRQCALLINNMKSPIFTGMTDYLYARPSILEGIGRNLDFFGALNRYNASESEYDADSTAFMADWLAVYNDMQKAYAQTKCQITAKIDLN
jgi:hypothetical protein